MRHLPTIALTVVVIFASVNFTSAVVPDGFTDAEIQRIFHRNRNNIPKYETVTLATMQKPRSKKEIRPVEFEVDGDKVRLQLTPIEHNSVYKLVPMWTVETDDQKPSRHTYKKLDQNEIKYSGRLYEDKDKMAVMSPHIKNGRAYYDGVFGDGRQRKVVRSMPEKWREVHGNESHIDHVVFAVNEGKNNTEAIGPSEPTSAFDRLEKPLDVLYPKLLLVVECTLFELLGKNVTETIQYVSIFWNVVNLKYRELTSPKVKIVITGIIIAKDHSALEYIHGARIPPDMNVTDPDKLLFNGRAYFSDGFHDEVDFRNYDSTMTMASLIAEKAGGAAYRGQICGRTFNFAFFYDDASYVGIPAAAHELGHLLNLPHDGEKAAKKCKDYLDDDTPSVMSARGAWLKEHFWSACSKRILHEFAMDKRAECMRHP